MSNFFTPDFNNESAIGPWNTSLEPTPGIIPKLDANGILTGGVGQEVNIPTLTPNTYDNIILPDASPTLMAKALKTDSNTSLQDSSVDLLTGQAMSEVYEDLSKFAAEPDFVTEMNVAFGENWDAAGAKALAEGWFNRDFSAIPPVKVVSSAEIGGANGSFAAATDTIYLSKEFLAQNGANPAAVADVLLEEIGHSVDARLNVTDSPGDEGAIFSRVVQGKDLSQGELQGLKGKDDIGIATIDGKILSVEYATTDEINEYYSKNWAVQAWNGSSNTNIWQPVSWSGRKTLGFGSNNRSDGKKGFAADWGDKSPGEGINKDNFYLNLWTQADFQQGGTYNFNVKADDKYLLAALPVGANDAKQWEFIGDGKWNGDAFSGKTFQFTPKNNGKYWVFAGYQEIAENAYFDISWEKTGQASFGSSSAAPVKPLNVPDGFTPVKSAKGVNLYESADKSDYVQVVDLSQGAFMTLRTGEQEYNSQTNGANGGTSPKFKRESIDTLWRNFSDRSSNPFSVVNGAFFAPGDNYTQLSDPLKITYTLFDGTESVVFDGTERRGDIDLKLEIGNERADITEFDGDLNSIKNSAYPLVLVGLKENIGENDWLGFLKGRTLVGVRDGDSNGTNETVLILTSKGKRIQDAARILKNFGANKIIQFDGSGSSQLIAQGQKYLNGDDRPIPQFIGVLSAA